MTVADMLESIAVLQQRSSPGGQLELIHSGLLWTAEFRWRPPVALDTVRQIEKDLEVRLPSDYVTFLSTVSDGPTLFYDVKYGQWGYRLYTVAELSEAQTRWTRLLPDRWQSHFIAFAEYYGDPEVLLFDPTRPTKDLLSYSVIEGNAYDRVDEWPVVSRSFHEWLDHLITAQGARYWQWT